MALGRVVIDLEAQYAAFTKGVHEVKEGVGEMGESLESLKHLAEGAFAFVGIEASAGAIKEMVGHTMEATAEAYRLSSSLGITTKSLQELQTAGLLGAGIKADEFDSILQKMVKSLGTAATGTGPAAEALKQLGISSDDLKGKHLDEAFTQIAQKISEVKDPTEQARLSTELFGKQGQQLLPLFQQGAEGIKKAAEEADKYGVALSDTDAAKVMQANEAFEHVGMAVQGVENQLTVALAPVLETIVNKILSIVPSADTMQHAFVSALKVVAEAVGVVEDAWNVLRLAGQGVSWALVGGLELVIEAVNKLAEGIVWVANKLGADWHLPEFMSNAETTVDNWRKQIQSDMAGTVDNLKHPNSEKWGEFFDSIQKDATDTAKKMADAKPMAPITADFQDNAGKITGILDKLKEQVATFGMTPEQKELLKLKDMKAPQADQDAAAALVQQYNILVQQKKVQEDINKLKVEAAQVGMTEAQKQLDNLKRAGANPEQVKQAGDLQQHIDDMKAWQDEQKEANKLIEQSMTPMEKYQEAIDKIQKLYNDGLLTDAQADDAVAKADKDLHKGDKDKKEKSDKVERRFDFRLPQQNPNDPQIKQLKAQNEANKHLAAIAQNTGKKSKVGRIV